MYLWTDAVAVGKLFSVAIKPRLQTGSERMSLQCPICKGIAQTGRHAVFGDHHWIDCPECGGEYEIGGLYAAILGFREQPMPELSAAIRQAFQTGQRLPMITERSVPEILSRFSGAFV